MVWGQEGRDPGPWLWPSSTYALLCYALGKFWASISSLYSVDSVRLDFLFPAAYTSWDLDDFQLSPCRRWESGTGTVPAGPRGTGGIQT